MLSVASFVVLSIFVCSCQSEIQLPKDVNSTFLFDGDELVIKITRKNGTINVIVANGPNGTNVPLPVDNMPTTELISIIAMIFCGVVVVVIIVLIIVRNIIFCYCYDTRNHEPLPTTVPREEARPTLEDREPAEPLLPKVNVKSPNRPSATTTKQTSPSTTKPSDEEPKIVVAPMPITPTAAPAINADVLSLTAASTQPSASDATLRTVTTPFSLRHQLTSRK